VEGKGGIINFEEFHMTVYVGKGNLFRLRKCSEFLWRVWGNLCQFFVRKIIKSWLLVVG
jgi:hypothetical protein